MSPSGADPATLHPPDHRSPSSSSAAAARPLPSSRAGPDPRRGPFPFSFRRPLHADPSSSTLVPSSEQGKPITAEGKPIPVDDSTAEHRTSALRELNNHYPSRHRYARSTGAQSSTYSEPVIVRSYYSPGPSRPVSKSRPGVVVHHGPSPTTLAASESGAPGGGVRRVLPFISTVAPAGNGMLSSMARTRARKLLSDSAPEQPRLPPIEAFSFKSFMANLEAEDDNDGINADLDRIAEICARSRYSLSNQYEVHYQPHGSGTSFLAESRSAGSPGPTLQVVSSDDERNLKRQRKRRGGARRNSRAMGTLETIMSSSRSSDEDKAKKKSAAEIAEEVRGRAAMKDSGDTSPSSSRGTAESPLSQDGQCASKAAYGRRSAASLALIDGPKQHSTSGATSSPRSSAIALVSQPSLPQASTSQLEIRTGVEQPSQDYTHRPKSGKAPPEGPDSQLAKEVISSLEGRNPGVDLLSALSGWMPWRSSDGSHKPDGRAEGSLRELLKTADVKGKGVERGE